MLGSYSVVFVVIGSLSYVSLSTYCSSSLFLSRPASCAPSLYRIWTAFTAHILITVCKRRRVNAAPLALQRCPESVVSFVPPTSILILHSPTLQLLMNPSNHFKIITSNICAIADIPILSAFSSHEGLFKNGYSLVIQEKRFIWIPHRTLLYNTPLSPTSKDLLIINSLLAIQ